MRLRQAKKIVYGTSRAAVTKTDNGYILHMHPVYRLVTLRRALARWRRYYK
jgi:hypothetical protein